MCGCFRCASAVLHLPAGRQALPKRLGVAPEPTRFALFEVNNMFKLSVITPMGPAFEGDANSVAAPGLEGGFEVYSGHMAMLAALKPGNFTIRASGGNTTFTISDGILEVSPDHNVLVLADSADPAK